MTNATISSLLIRFNSTVINPTSVVPLTVSSYILYNSTSFREQKDISPSSLVLQTEVLNISISLYASRTLTPTTLNISMVSPIKIKGAVFNIAVSFGTIGCAQLSLGSSLLSLQQVACSGQNVQLSTPADI